MSGPPWRHPGFARVIALVEERAGLMPPTCPPAAEEGIARAMMRSGHGEADFEGYLEHLARDAAALDDLLTELTIGETYFFRTHEHFDFVRQVALPELRQRRGPGHELRAWSAGCASGEEPYSLAVLLREEGWAGRMRVLGTDVSRAALRRSAEARYSPWSLRGTGAERMRPFLQPEGRRFVLASEVRESVRFDYLNLALDTWPSPASGVWKLDLIFCRNVLIYFNRPTVEAVARRLYASLAEGGYLIMGPSDPPLGGLAPLETLVTDWGLAYRRPEPGARPAPRPPPHAPPTPPPVPLAPPPVLLTAPPVPPTPPPAPAAPAPAPAPAPTEALDAEGLEGARQALGRGDWREAALKAGVLEADPRAAALAVRALANVDPQVATRACAEAARRHPYDVELRYLETCLLMGQGRLDEAERAARQVLYLEPGLAVAHLTLGLVLRRQGDRQGADQALRAAEALCSSLPPDTEVRLADGERAGRLAQVARGLRARLLAEADESEES